MTNIDTTREVRATSPKDPLPSLILPSISTVSTDNIMRYDNINM